MGGPGKRAEGTTGGWRRSSVWSIACVSLASLCCCGLWVSACRSSPGRGGVAVEECSLSQWLAGGRALATGTSSVGLDQQEAMGSLRRKRKRERAQLELSHHSGAPAGSAFETTTPAGGGVAASEPPRSPPEPAARLQRANQAPAPSRVDNFLSLGASASGPAPSGAGAPLQDARRKQARAGVDGDVDPLAVIGRLGKPLDSIDRHLLNTLRPTLPAGFSPEPQQGSAASAPPTAASAAGANGGQGEGEPGTIHPLSGAWASVFVDGVPSPARAADKREWHYRCLSKWREAEFAVYEPAWLSEASWPAPSAMPIDRATVRKHAFAVFDGLKHLLPGSPHAPPVSQVDFYGGPWIEDRWIAEFAKPVLRRLTDAHLEAIGRPPVKETLRVPPGWAERIVSMSQAELEAAPWPRAPPEGWPEDALEAVHIIEEPYDFELFHPWVPLFVPWENTMQLAVTIRHHFATAPAAVVALRDALAAVMRNEHQYITVVQRPAGPYVLEQLHLYGILRNTLVLSSGGHGQVPTPLLGAEQKRVPAAAVQPWGRTPLSVSFVGNIWHDVRHEMLETLTSWQVKQLQEQSPSEIVEPVPPQPPRIALMPQAVPLPAMVANVEDGAWQDIMVKSSLQLAPRGQGPTSFRFYEALQLGLIPVYVYDGGTPWLPYAVHNELAGLSQPPPAYTPPPAAVIEALERGERPPQQLHLVAGEDGRVGLAWQHLAIFVDAAGFHDWVRHDMPRILKDTARWKVMTAAINAARDVYFTYDGVLARIRELLTDPSSAALTCSLPHPTTMGDVLRGNA